MLALKTSQHNVQFWLHANKVVRDSGVPNYLQARIRVPSKFNFQYLETKLANYPNNCLLDYLKFGFPIEHDGRDVTHNHVNHKGASEEFYEHILKYLQVELKEGAILGPFRACPFIGQVGISPMNSVAKKDSQSRRVILDLSFPEGASVNDGIPADWYQGEHSKLAFPTIDDLVRIIYKKGVGCLLFKRDIRRAVNYIYDFGGADTPDQAWDAFYKLGSIIQQVGLTEAEDKASPPSTVMIFLGLEVNTITMTIKIPQQKLIEIRMELGRWFLGRRVTKKQMQSLVGILNFAAGCIKPGRIYFSRILNVLRRMDKEVVVQQEIMDDIDWWKVCAGDFNGVSLMMEQRWERPGQTVHTDACLLGVGGITQYECFHRELTMEQRSMFTDINQIECFTILLAVRLLGKEWGCKNIVINCDNHNTVLAINSGTSKDGAMQCLLRNLNWECVKFSIMIRAVLLTSEMNAEADCLSRMHLHDKFRVRF